MFYCSSRSYILPGGSDGKPSAYNAWGPGSIPESERYPGKGNGHALHYSCLENSIKRGVWWNTVHGVAKNHTLSDWHFHCFIGLFSAGLTTKITRLKGGRKTMSSSRTLTLWNLSDIRALLSQATSVILMKITLHAVKCNYPL